MAKFIPDPIRKLVDSGTNFIKGNELGYGLKPFRTKILVYDRLLRGFEKVDINGPGDSYVYEYPYLGFPGPKKHRQNIGRIKEETGVDNSGYTFEPVREYTKESLSQRINFGNDETYINGNTNEVSIIIPDYTKDTIDNGSASSGDKPNLSNRRYKSLTLPFVPRELDFKPESNFVGISSFGRNNPFYQFTGAEDTLTFEIDWLSLDESREDVITYCRWIEALTKGDGYDAPPPEVILSWGHDNKLFQDYKWVVTAAPYRMKNFSKGFIKGDQFINNHLLPSQAYQQVTMKRVTDDNLKSSDIIGKLFNK